MLSKISRVIILVLSIFLITFTNSLAFHKKKSITQEYEIEWDGKKETKKEFEIEEKRLSCAYKVTAFIKKGEAKIDKKTGEDLYENGKKIFEDDQYKINMQGYHLQSYTKIPADGYIRPNLLNSLNFDLDYKNLKLVDLLKIYCIQDKTKDRPPEFKGSYLEQLYLEIAIDNGYDDYNQTIYNNPKGSDILKKGFIIKNPNVVWHVPDYLIDEYKEQEKKRIEEDKKAKQKAEEDRKREEKRKKQKAKENAEKEASNKWISENKQIYLEEFNALFSVFKNNIEDLKNERKKLNQLFKEYKELIKNTEEEIDIAFDDLINIQDDEVKNLKTKIRENKNTFLSNDAIEIAEKDVNEINQIKFSYSNYKKLEDIILKAEKSKLAGDFIGKDKLEYEALGKIYVSNKGPKVGLIKKFKDIENQLLGSFYSKHIKMLNDLRNKLQLNIKDIQQYILEPVDQIKALDEELESRIPWGKYFIYLIIFIIVVSAIGFLILQQRKMKALQEESEKKVGSLKSDFEGKLRSAAEQMRSVKSQPAQNTENIEQNVKPQVQETPKTPEQIIAEKYDELISEYNDALNDFSKVATFKQKWSGLALSRKERQDGTKTILISSSRAFEKSEIWCVTFSDKFFGLPGSSVKSNMATYMNLDFEKANRDFKGVFSIATGTTYSVEPCVLRKGGAGFVVERSGKITFPS